MVFKIMIKLSNFQSRRLTGRSSVRCLRRLKLSGMEIPPIIKPSVLLSFSSVFLFGKLGVTDTEKQAKVSL